MGQRRTGTEYVRKIDFVFYNEKEIRQAVLDAREASPPPSGVGSKNHVSNPTEAKALRNLTLLRNVRVQGRDLEWPERWLKVIDTVYAWCDAMHRAVAKDRYSNKDYRRTCVALNISIPQ